MVVGDNIIIATCICCNYLFSVYKFMQNYNITYNMRPFHTDSVWKMNIYKVTRSFFASPSSSPLLSLLIFNSSSISCVSAWNRPEPPEGETDEPEDGQQVGKCGGVHRRDAERGAGVLHPWRALQSPACTGVWLPGRGMIARLHGFRVQSILII